jgi:exodeoxyribonuclease V beta subunit
MDPEEPEMTRGSDFLPTGADAISRGITLLEASAGTGKTFNIASAVLRLVAEHGVPMREIVVVTFTRAATAELKDRIRRRIGEAIAVLEGRAAPHGNEILSMLAARDAPRRLRHLLDARESFDECLISTIHGFCQRMLHQNAFEAKSELCLDLLADTTPLKEQIVDDWLSRSRYADDPDRYEFLVHTCGFDRAWLLTLADRALRDPDAKVLPLPEETDAAGWPAERDAFLRKWQAGWADSLPALFEKAHERGVFEPRGQRTYRQKKCADEVASMTAWLEMRPAIGTLPDNAAYFSTRDIGKKLSGTESAPENEALRALRRLLAYQRRRAACEASSVADYFRTEADRRLRAHRAQSYQDLVRSLARVLGEKGSRRSALVAAIGNRFKAALIDEFQDTDAQQWTIFREIFGGGNHWLYLIGDPKQAIYGFRGANVHVYLAAKANAKERVFTIRQNFRTDQRLLDALNHVCERSGFFGEPGIEFFRATAAPRENEPADRISYGKPPSDPWTAPLQLRFVDARITGAGRLSPDDKPVSKADAGRSLPVRVTNDVTDLLESSTEVYDPDGKGAGVGGFRPLRPGDIAVLTHSGQQAGAVHDTLLAANVPAVLHGADSVLASRDALDLLRWLEALAAPGDHRAARTAATTRLFGRDATLIARVEAQDPRALETWERWLDRLGRWRQEISDRGFLSTLRTAIQDDVVSAALGTAEEDATTRLLRRSDGERALTNIWHLAELLHEAETTERLHLAGLLAWLKRQRSKTTVDAETSEMRLERDDDAVAVMTMHKAKGLEFPVVFVPYLWDAHGIADDEPLLLPSAEDPAERVLDLRARHDPAVLARAEREGQKEQLRLFYVALTRAKYRAVVYTGHISSIGASSLAAALHGDPRGTTDDRITAGARRTGNGRRADLFDDLSELANGSRTTLADGSKTISLTVCERPQSRQWLRPEQGSLPLAARDFLRFGLDHTWRRHSYSSLAHAGANEIADDGDDREGFDADRETPAAHGAGAIPAYIAPKDVESVPLAAFPAGAAAGTLIHDIFENADFRWAHPGSGTAAERELGRVVRDLLVAHGFDAEKWSSILHSGLTDVLRTPLGGPLGTVRLCDVARQSRFDELRFDFPIAGGSAFGKDGRRSRVTSDRIAAALGQRKKARAADDERIMRTAWIDAMKWLGPIAGFMTGSIDLVFRHEVEGHARWFLADYKSNRIDPHGTGRFPIEHFAFDFMRCAMEQNSYYLQYHLYLLALHRYLRLRLGVDARGKDLYDYDRDIGGVYYLFVRGMIGERTPLDGPYSHGCFYDKPPFEVIDALDRLFDDPAGAQKGGGR